MAIFIHESKIRIQSCIFFILTKVSWNYVIEIESIDIKRWVLKDPTTNDSSNFTIITVWLKVGCYTTKYKAVCMANILALRWAHFDVLSIIKYVIQGGRTQIF